MRDGSHLWGLGGPLVKAARSLTLAAACCGVGLSTAAAQQPGYPVVNTAANVPTGGLDDLQARLEQQQREIQQLQAQLTGLQANSDKVQATPVSMESASELADAGGPQLPPGATVVATNDKTALNAYWNSGVWLQSANEDFKVHFGGRIQFDAFNTFRPSHDAAVDFDDKGTPFEDSQGFRRDRLRVEGTIYDSIDFVWEYDFATAINSKNITSANSNGVANPNGSSLFTGTGITDMNATLKNLPIIQNVSVGSFLVPFSFELGTSDRWMDFIERSAAFDSFVPATNFANYTLGAKTFGWNEDETWTYAASISENNMWDGASGFMYGNDYMFTGRTTILPYYACEGRKLIEVGVSGCFQKCQEDPLNGNIDSTQIRSRFAAREYLSPLAQAAVDTGAIGAERQNTIGAELIAQDGSLSWESEYYGTWVDGTSGGAALGAENLYFFGYYTQVGYFLTGENRNYNRQKADYERVVPYENWFRAPGDYNCCTGLGAVQVCARYSYVSLDNGNVHGGQEDEYTFGLNWFLNPNLKFQFDYDYTSYSDRATSATFPFSHGTVGALGTRMDLDF